ncbi:hypothetical protein KAT80_03965 [Candidatus Pacearchaeota archaeon]|nr:hypothetical protein [Candidatus Pacearchaeota archaeon]
MEKRGQTKIILTALIILVFIGGILILFFVVKNKETKISEDEVREIVGEITDDEIINVYYYKKCNVLDSEYEKVHVVVTKLKEKVSDIFGEFDYKYYFLDKDGNIFSETYYKNEKTEGLCEKLE